MTVSRFTWATAVQTGSGHLADGIECHDSLGVRHLVDQNGQPWIVAVSADGAGSVVRAKDGSSRAVAHVLAFLALHIETLGADHIDAAIVMAAQVARFRIGELARSEGLSLSDFATTLNVCVSNGDMTAFAQIGDGAMIVHHPDSGTWTTALPPQVTEFANVSVFLTSADWLDHLAIRIVREPVSTLLVTTDGFRDLVLQPVSFEPQVGFLDRLGHALRSAPGPGPFEPLSKFLQSLAEADHVREGTADDISLIALEILPEVQPWSPPPPA